MTSARRIARAAATAIGKIVPIAAVALLLFLGLGPRSGAYRTLTVLTGSMSPKIPAGSVVVVTPMPAGAIKAGDVITYNAPIEDGRVVTHRVVEARQRNFGIYVRTKGDANTHPDPWTAKLEGDTVWKVRAVLPGAGRAIMVLRSPGFSKLTLFGAPLLLALIWLWDIWRGEPRDPPVCQEGATPAPA